MPATERFCSSCGREVNPPPGLPRDIQGALKPGTLLQNCYLIERFIVKSGFAFVYRAQDFQRGNQPCAIKELLDKSEESQRQFEREASLLTWLQHRGLVRVYDYFDTSDGELFLVMAYVEGDDLEQVRSKIKGFLPEARIVNWARQICDVLEYMHTWVDPTTGQPSPVIHRDIKPGNVRLGTLETITVIDLGIAKVKEPGRKTTRAARAVSPPYSPFEQYGAGTDERSDIYALGATLYHLATGTEPPEAPDRPRVPLIPPRKLNPNLSIAFDEAILKAMHTEPNRRFQTISEMRAALMKPGPAAKQVPDQIHALLADALDRRKWVYVTYTNLQGTTRRRNVLPLALSSTYLKAFCELSQSPLTFRVGRISFASIEETKFVPPVAMQNGVYIRPTSDRTVRTEQPKWVPDPGPYLASGEWEVVPLPSVAPTAAKATPSPATPSSQPGLATPAVQPKQPSQVAPPPLSRLSSPSTALPQGPAPRPSAASAKPPTKPALASATSISSKPIVQPSALRGLRRTLINHFKAHPYIWLFLTAASILIGLLTASLLWLSPQTPAQPIASEATQTPSPTSLYPTDTIAVSTHSLLPNATLPRPTEAPTPQPTRPTPRLNTTPTPIPTPGSAAADVILAYNPGPGANPQFQNAQDLLGPPDLVEAPQLQGVVQLGRGGSVLVAFSDNSILDGDGPDFQVYGEPARDDYLIVEVSADGETWYAYPKANESPPGFDLGDAGLDRAVFVRLIDLQPATPTGAEVDAIVALHNEPGLQPRLPTLPDAVSTQDLTLYEGPSKQMETAGRVSKGEPVDLLGRDAQNKWVRVRSTRRTSNMGWCLVSSLVLNISLSDLSLLTAPPTPTPTSKPTQVSPTRSATTATPESTPGSGSSRWVLVADSRTDYPGPVQDRKWWYLWSTSRYTFNWQDMEWDDPNYCYRSPGDAGMGICQEWIRNSGRGDVAVLWKARQGGTYRFEWDANSLLFYDHLSFVGSQGPGPTLANSAIVEGVIDWELFFWVARSGTGYHIRVYRLQE